MEDVRTRFRHNFGMLMDMYGVSNADVARYVDVSREIVGQWRSGKCHPAPNRISKLAEMLKCNVDDLFCPFYLLNLRRLMKKHQVNPVTMSLVLENISFSDINNWVSGEAEPTFRDKQKICQYFKECHGERMFSLDDPPHLIPLKKWARDNDIPLKRAEDMVEMNLLEWTENSPFGVLVPSDVTPPDDNKKLVWLARQRPQFGTEGLENFIPNFFDRIAKLGRSWNDETIADEVGVHPGTISHWRAGLRTPNEENMVMLAEICECEVTDFFKPHRKSDMIGE